MRPAPAGHFEIQGKDLEAVVDTAGIAGDPVVSLQVDGQLISSPEFATTPLGHVITAVIETVPDSHTSEISVVFPEVNVVDEPATFSCFATVTTTVMSIAGPSGVNGPLQHYELRPLAGKASSVLA